MVGTRKPNGEARIRQLPSGSWHTQVLVAGRRHSVTGRTKEDVQRRRRELLANADKGVLPPAERLTLGQFIERWLEPVVRSSVRPRTLCTRICTAVCSRRSRGG